MHEFSKTYESLKCDLHSSLARQTDSFAGQMADKFHLVQESVEDTMSSLQFQIDSQAEMSEARLAKIAQRVEEVAAEVEGKEVAQIANLDPINELVTKKLQTLSTDLLQATSKLVLLSE